MPLDMVFVLIFYVCRTTEPKLHAKEVASRTRAMRLQRNKCHLRVLGHLTNAHVGAASSSASRTKPTFDFMQRARRSSGNEASADTLRGRSPTQATLPETTLGNAGQRWARNKRSMPVKNRAPIPPSVARDETRDI